MDTFEFDDDDILKLTKIQALYRRHYVKNEMQKLRKDYEDIFLEIEGADTDTQIIWPNEHKLCYPRFSSKKSKIIKKTKNENINQASSNDTKSNTAEKLNQHAINNETKNLEKKLNDSKSEIKSTESENENNSLLNNSQKELLNLDIDAKQLDYLRTDNLKKLNVSELNELKENVSLEILWIQQAIQSRIQYLNLKKTIEDKKKSSS